MKNLILICAILLFCSQTFARGSSGPEVSANGMYLITNTVNGSTTTTSNRTLLDGVLGYRFSNNLFLGGTYDYDTTSSSMTGSSDTNITIGSYGVTGGLDTGNFYLLGTYFIGSEYDFTVGSIKTAETSGSGFQATIGYRFNVNSHFAIGPQFSYRSLSYTTEQVGSAPSTSVSSSSTAFLPYINFTYTFGSGGSSDD